jgi:nitrite reductase/ring-hydroxylating ferredoxin subunit
VEAIHGKWLRAASLDEVRARGYLTLQLDSHTIALFYHAGQVYAVDNRCPHMGFPLDRGAVHDGILTCYWHYARFDVATGGTFDQWADDVRAFPVTLRDDEVWIDLTPRTDPVAHQRERLRIGLERDLSLVIGKAVLVLTDAAPDGLEPFRVGLDFGVRYRDSGWGQGLTMHTCMMNLLPHLAASDRPRALYHGLSAVARDTAGRPPRFAVPPLPGGEQELATLKRWFRRFIAVRDHEGAERCVVSAIRSGAPPQALADMLFAAVTDYRYIDIGHPADFTNKAFEALDWAGWECAEPVLTSLVRGYAAATRMEEANAWRNPVDLIAILEKAFTELPALWTAAPHRHNHQPTARDLRRTLVDLLLGDDPHATGDALLAALRDGATPVDLASTVSYAAALRIARFHTSNELSDWDTALHTFTFAGAIEQGLRRAPSVELLRGVFDAAMSIYLDRFLNIPATRIPEPAPSGMTVDALDALTALLDRRQQVNPAAQQVATYLAAGDDASPLLAHLGKLLLREDRDFHTIQMIEAAIRQVTHLDEAEARSHVLIAAARYLAAHAPTLRAQEQTYQIAQRLHQGDRLFEAE